jgi:hypothetical protein
VRKFRRQMVLESLDGVLWRHRGRR